MGVKLILEILDNGEADVVGQVLREKVEEELKQLSHDNDATDDGQQEHFFSLLHVRIEELLEFVLYGLCLCVQSLNRSGGLVIGCQLIRQELLMHMSGFNRGNGMRRTVGTKSRWAGVGVDVFRWCL